MNRIESRLLGEAHETLRKAIYEADDSEEFEVAIRSSFSSLNAFMAIQQQKHEKRIQRLQTGIEHKRRIGLPNDPKFFDFMDKLKGTK